MIPLIKLARKGLDNANIYLEQSMTSLLHNG